MPDKQNMSRDYSKFQTRDWVDNINKACDIQLDAAGSSKNLNFNVTDRHTLGETLMNYQGTDPLVINKGDSRITFNFRDGGDGGSYDATSGNVSGHDRSSGKTT